MPLSELHTSYLYINWKEYARIPCHMQSYALIVYYVVICHYCQLHKCQLYWLNLMPTVTYISMYRLYSCVSAPSNYRSSQENWEQSQRDCVPQRNTTRNYRCADNTAGASVVHCDIGWAASFVTACWVAPVHPQNKISPPAQKMNKSLLNNRGWKAGHWTFLTNLIQNWTKSLKKCTCNITVHEHLHPTLYRYICTPFSSLFIPVSPWRCKSFVTHKILQN